MRVYLHAGTAFLLFATCALCTERLDSQQILTFNNISHFQGAVRVAIIGAGIAGASAAYALSEQSRELVDFDVTIFEASSQVGGRLKHTNQFGNPRRPVEVGPTTYSANDWCIAKAVKEAGLEERTMWYENSWGTWNGKEIIYQQKESQDKLSWWDLIELIWRYGWSPRTFLKSVAAACKGFGSFAMSVSVTDGILTEFSNRHFDPNYLASADEYLNGIGISQSFKSEVIEPRTRLTMGRDLSDLTGLDMALSMTDAKRKMVYESNHQLIHRLLRLSGVKLRLNSRIQSITPGRSKRYRLLADTSQNKVSDLDYNEFDVVIVAVPLQASDITFDNVASVTTRPLRPYVERHVTHFASTDRLSRRYFQVNASLPDSVLTTKGFRNFFAIEWLGRTCYFFGFNASDALDYDQCEEDNLYRILSADTIPDSAILSVLGKNTSSESHLNDLGIHWVHREVWKHATPIYQDQSSLLNDVQIGPFLFYTGGAEALYTSHEMSCRMGKSVGTEVFLRHMKWYD